jgi:opacity protein-like surface antigen
MTLPEDTGFYPPLPETALVPARGFGLDGGAHLYFGRAGPARLGAGASVAFVRGTTPEATALSSWVVAPQLSFNFGTADGWSYLSAGVGAAGTRGEFTSAGGGETTTRRSDTLLALNVGGGARWFFTDHLAVGFDLRLHRISGQEAQVGLAGTPSSLLFLASVGLSMK